jgi:predicted nucleotidyltransferase
MQSSSFGLSDNAHQTLLSTFRLYPEVKKVIVYGSRAKGNFSARSDIDLVIRDSQVSMNKLGEIRDQLEESDFPYLVDLQIYEDITNENLIEHIKRVGKVIYERS